MEQTWQGWNLETFPGGVSSAVSPDLLPPNQCAWGMNADFRGSKVMTRPNIEQQLFLPNGLVQGAGFFNIQGGMLIVMIDGFPYRIRIGVQGGSGFSCDKIPGTFQNSPIIQQVWMAQTAENFLIQDGQSDCIIYNGSTARRADQTIPEVPRGTHMAYANGRLWVAGEGNQLAAGDIYTGVVDSELSFTETQYLSGGGTLSFSDNITGLAFIPSTGTSDYGPLLVFGRTFLETVRADVTNRDTWASYPGFVTNALRSVGTPSGWTIVQVNEDLFWRDVLGGIRSLNTMLTAAYFAQYRGAQGDANVPISREVSRLADFDSQQLLGFSSGVYFDNRMLMTSSPFLNNRGGVSFRDLISLDFAPTSTMQGQAPPAYNGTWQGVNWTKLVQGEFNGMTRAFGISSDDDGLNRLWEFGTGGTDDVYLLSDGSNTAQAVSPIESFVEYPRIAFQDPKKRKRLTRCDVWLSNIVGQVNLSVFWRPDNYQQWTLWDSTTHCAVMTDGSTGFPHIWQNLLPEQRPLIKTFSIPDSVDPISGYDLCTGFGFQVRVVWNGSLKIERVSVWAEPLDDDDYVNRDGQSGDCIPNNVTGNEINYQIPLGPQFLIDTTNWWSQLDNLNANAIGSGQQYTDSGQIAFNGTLVGLTVSQYLGGTARELLEFIPIDQWSTNGLVNITKFVTVGTPLMIGMVVSNLNGQQRIELPTGLGVEHSPAGFDVTLQNFNTMDSLPSPYSQMFVKKPPNSFPLTTINGFLPGFIVNQFQGPTDSAIFNQVAMWFDIPPAY